MVAIEILGNFKVSKSHYGVGQPTLGLYVLIHLAFTVATRPEGLDPPLLYGRGQTSPHRQYDSFPEVHLFSSLQFHTHLVVIVSRVSQTLFTVNVKTISLVGSFDK